MLYDLQSRPIQPPDRQVLGELDWSEVAAMWDANELDDLHDWLNRRWSRLIRNSVLGTDDPEAQFLQALAFATLALYFTQHHNQEGALMMVDDALLTLTKYSPRFMGVEVEPIVATLLDLRPLLVGLAPDAACPVWPFVYAKFQFHRRAP
jgi:hypothetical protein